jgi:hypothetical protein
MTNASISFPLADLMVMRLLKQRNGTRNWGNGFFEELLKDTDDEDLNSYSIC